MLYTTPIAVLERIPSLVKEIIQGIDQTRFDCADFAAFGDSAPNFEVVYYVLDPDYNLSNGHPAANQPDPGSQAGRVGGELRGFLAHAVRRGNRRPPNAPRCNCSRAAAGSGLTTPKAIEKAKHTLLIIPLLRHAVIPPYLSAVGKPDDSDPLTRRASILEKIDVGHSF